MRQTRWWLLLKPGVAGDEMRGLPCRLVVVELFVAKQHGFDQLALHGFLGNTQLLGDFRVAERIDFTEQQYMSALARQPGDCLQQPFVLLAQNSKVFRQDLRTRQAIIDYLRFARSALVLADEVDRQPFGGSEQISGEIIGVRQGVLPQQANVSFLAQILGGIRAIYPLHQEVDDGVVVITKQFGNLVLADGNSWQTKGSKVWGKLRNAANTMPLPLRLR